METAFYTLVVGRRLPKASFLIKTILSKTFVDEVEVPIVLSKVGLTLKVGLEVVTVFPRIKGSLITSTLTYLASL